MAAAAAAVWVAVVAELAVLQRLRSKSSERSAEETANSEAQEAIADIAAEVRLRTVD